MKRKKRERERERAFTLMNLVTEASFIFMCKSHLCIKLCVCSAPTPAPRRTPQDWAWTGQPADWWAWSGIRIRKDSFAYSLPFYTFSRGDVFAKVYDWSFSHPAFSYGHPMPGTLKKEWSLKKWNDCKVDISQLFCLRIQQWVRQE